MIVLAQAEPFIDGAARIAELDSVRQLTFALVLMGVVGVILALAFLSIENGRNRREKNKGEQDSIMLKQMVQAVNQSAQAQANLAGWERVIERLTESEEDTSALIKQNIGQMSVLAASINKMAEIGSQEITKTGEVQTVVVGLRADMKALVETNKERMEAIDLLSKEMAISKERGDKRYADIMEGLTEIRRMLGQSDSQMLQMRNQIDTVIAKNKEQQWTPIKSSTSSSEASSPDSSTSSTKTEEGSPTASPPPSS